jgi:periplasmic protein TonB
MNSSKLNSLVEARWAPAAALAVVAAFGMFWMMNSIIDGVGLGAEKSEVLPTIDFVRLKRDTEVETLERRKPPPPPPPEQPPPPARMTIAADATPQQAAPTPFPMPNLGLSASVGGGPFIGQMGGGGAIANGGFFDGDIIPLQRMQPVYPRDALRARITGWVQLEVTVNADGTVSNARVVDASPKGLFDAAAVGAVYKWKFRPKMVNGQAVAQRGSQRIEFNLSS